MDNKKEFALQQHEKWKGKIEIVCRAPLETPEDLAVAYTPGVAEPCLKISENTDLSYQYTRRGNLVAVITDGTAVLGLGDIGPRAISESLWKENALYLSDLAMWMPSLFVFEAKM